MTTPTKSCLFAGCTGASYARGLCQKHYARWYRHGDPTICHRAWSETGVCAADGCDLPVYGYGWCQKHYSRWRRHGDTATMLRAASGDGGLASNGYRRVTINGRRVLEHRAVWERAHGPIPPRHDVHHINGDRADNRLDNLELMSHSDHVRLHSTNRPSTPHDSVTPVK